MTVEPLPRVASNSWMFLVMGVVSAIAGVLAIVYPDLTLLALGICAIVVAFRMRSLLSGEPGAAPAA